LFYFVSNGCGIGWLYRPPKNVLALLNGKYFRTKREQRSTGSAMSYPCGCAMHRKSITGAREAARYEADGCIV